MRIAAGIDLVEVEEVREAVAAHGDRYLARVFTAVERVAAGDRPRSLALTLAAKEATFKALAVPADAQSVWQDVEITRWRAELRGELRRAHPDVRVTVSGSSDRRQALAVAIVEER